MDERSYKLDFIHFLATLKLTLKPLWDGVFGHGAWGRVTYALCPMPYALCPMPYAPSRRATIPLHATCWIEFPADFHKDILSILKN